MAYPDTPHFDLPFRFVRGAAVVVEQDSYRDVHNCVEALVRYPLGFRDDRPDFGITDETFSIINPDSAINVDDIQDAITVWEPRADELIESDPSTLQDYIAIVRVVLRGDQDG